MTRDQNIVIEQSKLKLRSNFCTFTEDIDGATIDDAEYLDLLLPMYHILTLSIYLSIYLSVYLSFYISKYISISTTVMWLPQEIKFQLNQSLRLMNAKAERNLTLSIQWNYSSYATLLVSASGTIGLIAHVVRAAERNSVFLGSNPTQANFL